MDGAEFFDWYVSNKLVQGKSLEVHSTISTFCVSCETERSNYVNVGHYVTTGGMVPLDDVSIDFESSIPAIMNQYNPLKVSEVREPCPNLNCGGG